MDSQPIMGIGVEKTGVEASQGQSFRQTRKDQLIAWMPAAWRMTIATRSWKISRAPFQKVRKRRRSSNVMQLSRSVRERCPITDLAGHPPPRNATDSYFYKQKLQKAFK